MKNVISLVLAIFIIGLIANCNNSNPTDSKDSEQSQGKLSKENKLYRIPDYFVLTPKTYGIRTYEVTFGENLGQQIVGMITGTETVPYTSGELTGSILTYTTDAGGTGSEVWYNDGINLMDLKSDDLYMSNTCALEAFPPDRVLGTVYDGMIIDPEPARQVKDDFSECRFRRAGLRLIQIQDIYVYGKKYNKAIIIWGLDKGVPYQEPEFYGKDIELGIKLPTSEETENNAINEWGIVGYKEGLIVFGFITALMILGKV